MLITKNIAYLELHKTGCSHVLKVLQNLYGDTCRIEGKHNTYDSVFDAQSMDEFRGLTKIGNIRNPWDWYVSLWSFGCQGEGGLHTRLTIQRDLSWKKLGGIRKQLQQLTGREPRRRSKEYWSNLYTDVNDVSAFRTWLKAVLAEPGHSLGEGYKSKPMGEVAGLMTYRFIKLYTYREQLNEIETTREVASAARDGFVSVYLRNEHLHEDLIANADALGTTPEQMKEVLTQFQTRTNASQRLRDYQSYYDEESRHLVAQADAYLIERFGYTFD